MEITLMFIIATSHLILKNLNLNGDKELLINTLILHSLSPSLSERHQSNYKKLIFILIHLYAGVIGHSMDFFIHVNIQ